MRRFWRGQWATAGRKTTRQRSQRRSAGALAPRVRAPALEHLEDRTLLAFSMHIVLGTVLTNVTNDGNGNFTANATGAQVGVSNLRAALLAGKDVTVSSGSSGSETGSITWDASANLDIDGIAATRTLTLKTGSGSANAFIELHSDIFDSNTASATDQLNVVLTAKDGVVFSGTDDADIDTRGGTFSADADSDDSGAGNYTQNTGTSVTTLGGAVDIQTANPILAGTIDSTSGNVQLEPSLTGATIGLGNGGSGTFSLTTNELGRISTTGTLTIGSSIGTGAVDVGSSDETIDLSSRTYHLTLQGGDVTIDGNLTLPGGTTMRVLTSGSISGSASGNEISIGGSGAVLLDAASNINVTGDEIEVNAATIAARTRTAGGMFINATFAGTVIIGSISGGFNGDTVSGLSTAAHQEIRVTATDSSGSLSVNQAISSGSGNLTLRANNGVSLAGSAADVTMTGGTYTINADFDSSGVGTYTQVSSADVNSANNNITVSITAADVSLTGALKSGTSTTTIVPTNSRQIDLGTDTAGKLGLTDAELGQITASKIVVGNSSAGAVTFSAAVSLANSNVLEVITGSTINDTGSSTVFTDTSLALNAAAGIGTSSTLNVAVSNLAATAAAGGVNVTNTGNVTLSTVGGVTGVTATASNVSIAAASSITVSEPVSATGSGTVLLDAQGGDSGDIIVNNTVTTASGSLTLRADDDISSSSSGTLTTTSGAVTVTADDDASSSGTITYTAAINHGSSGSTFSLADADGSITGVVGGTGGLTKQGGGTLTLSGTNTYTGATTINAGTLKLGASNVLADATSVTVNAGGTLNLNDQNDTITSLTLVGSGTVSDATTASNTLTLASTGTALTLQDGADITNGNVKLALSGASGGSVSVFNTSGTPQASGQSSLSASLDLGTVSRTFSVADINSSGSDVFFAGVISGSGGVIKTGDGILKYTNTNTYTGLTDVQGGTLFIQGSSANNPVNRIPDTNTVQVSGGTLNVTSASETIDQLILVSGSVITDTSGSSGTLTATSGYDVRSGTISDIILAGSAGLTKSTSGTVTLNSANTYSGTTTVSQGTLEIQHANALGSTAAGTSVASGATLKLSPSSGTSFAAEALTLNGTLRNAVSNNTWQGTIALGSTIQVNSGTTLTVSSAISGTDLNKTGAGTLIVQATNTYTGATNIQAGTLQLDSGSNRLPTGTTVTLGTASSSTGGVLALNARGHQCARWHAGTER